MDQPKNPGQHDPLKPSTPPGTGTNTGGGSTPHPDSVPEAPPLTPMAWLAQNGVYVVLFFAFIIWLYRNWGLDGIWRAGLVALGLSFVVFIHELGHFLAAKWCDVHVTTFSLGFGPAVPGCSFVRGETTYMVGILPLGGYVAMVGEGPEADEDENYPRSFKNKGVGQRMLIISAGVILNVILGAACFIFVYMAHGRDRPLALISAIDAGSPAWQRGVRSGVDVLRVGSNDHPFYDDLRLEVAISQTNQKIPFTFRQREGKAEPFTIELEPRKEFRDPAPVIGVLSAGPLKLPGARMQAFREIPAYYASAAAAARVVDFKPGDRLLSAQVAGSDTVVPLAASSEGVKILCQMFRDHPKKAIQVRVQRAGQATGSEDVTIEPKGIEVDDEIVATTDPAAPDSTFTLSDLPVDPTQPTSEHRDPIAYRLRVRQLAGYPVALRLIRGDSKATLLVPPAAVYVLPGVRFAMGQVAALRENSPAKNADQLVVAGPNTKGDILSRIEAIRPDSNGKETIRIFENVEPKEGMPPPANVVELDPLRLPYDLARFAGDPARDRSKKMRVKLTVLRDDKATHKDRQPTPLSNVLEWDDSWDTQDDVAHSRNSPLAISQLGLAYRVENTIDQLQPESAAAKAGLKKGDRLDKITFYEVGKKRDDEGKWGKPFSLETERVKGQKAFDSAAHLGALLQQNLDSPRLKFNVHREGKDLEEPIELTATLSPDRFALNTQGFWFFPDDRRLQKADGLLDALGIGVNETLRFLKMMYLNLSSLLTGRLSTDTLGGPIEIAAQTFSMAEDPFVLIYWLGIISINLAVVNFLPIPVLDGGHMVFLIYEWLRGKPASQNVQAAATYVGLAMILSLMVFVIYLDVKRRLFGL